MVEAVSKAGNLGWLVRGLAFLALVTALTLLARYRLIEPLSFAAACERHVAPWDLCLLRQILVVLFVKNIAGMASTLFGVWSTITRSRAMAFAALCFGAISTILYRFDSAVIGVLLAVLVLARAAVARPKQAGGEYQPQRT